MLGIAFVAALGIASFIVTKSVPAVLVSGFLCLGLAFYAYERLFPLGAQTLYRTRVRLAVPGNSEIEIRPSPKFTSGRIFVIFDRSKAFFNGVVRVQSENRQLAIKTLPVVEQFQDAFGGYNRALTRDSDRIYLDIRRQDAETIILELRLWPNVTDSKLKQQFDLADTLDIEILLKGKL
jgi:hypothetical protein